MPGHSLPLHLLAMAVALTMSVAVLAGPIVTDSATKHSAKSLASLARRAVGAHNDESADAVAALRSTGPEGLRAFLELNRPELEAALKAAINAHDGDSRRVKCAIAQGRRRLTKCSRRSTQFANRRTAMRHSSTGTPTSNRLSQPRKRRGSRFFRSDCSGGWTKSLSCANSRLFRITLYANEQISKLLRDRFVLHWQSVRSVPRVTIDFGDGRKIERTLTGNSIHYVLDSEGRLIDALPGMYGPGAFLRELVRAEAAAVTLRSFRTDDERGAALRRYHDSRYGELEKSWLSDVKQAGLRVAPSRETPVPPGPGSNPPSAAIAASAAVSKTTMVERPVLRGMTDNPKLLDSIGSDAGWSMIAGLHARDAALDQRTRGLMSVKDPALSGPSLEAAITALERSVAEDTVRNEYVFRSRIHKWLASGAVSSDVASLNEKIYSELFLTPSWDPWLGLRPAGTYSGIDGGRDSKVTCRGVQGRHRVPQSGRVTFIH